MNTFLATMKTLALIVISVGPVAVIGEAPQTVGVIGGGMGAAAFAYYYKEANPTAKVIVFETRDYVGGRLKHTTMHNTTIELGGDAWSTVANHYIVDLARKLGLQRPSESKRRRTRGGVRTERPRTSTSLAPPESKHATDLSTNLSSAETNRSNNTRVTDPPLEGIGIWNGTAVIPIGPLLRNLGDDETIAKVEAQFLWDLDANYAARGSAGTFDSVSRFLSTGALTKFTNVSATTFFTQVGISLASQDLILEPLSRGIYDQNLARMQAFSAIVAVTSLLGADQFDGGNSVLVEKMLAASGADVRLQTKVAEVRDEPNGRFTVIPSASSHYAEPISVDAVIVACPVEFADVKFPATTTVPPPRHFQRIFVTIVRAAGLQAAYFGLNSTRPIKFNNILTSRGAAATSPFVVIEQEVELPDGTALWKLFSNDDVRAKLPQLFTGISSDPADTVVQVWPYTFPELLPVTDTSSTQYQPLKLDDGIFYINAMESVASAMEGSIIGGRNLALTLRAL